jgi:hypothetical protein
MGADPAFEDQQLGPAKARFAQHEKDSGLLAAPGAKPVRSVARGA